MTVAPHHVQSLFGRLSARRGMASYRKRMEEKERLKDTKGHNHPADQKCGPHCPRNEKYKGPEKKPNILYRNRR